MSQTFRVNPKLTTPPTGTDIFRVGNRELSHYMREDPGAVGIALSPVNSGTPIIRQHGAELLFLGGETKVYGYNNDWLWYHCFWTKQGIADLRDMLTDWLVRNGHEEPAND